MLRSSVLAFAVVTNLCLIAMPFAAEGQTAEKVHRIGMLWAGTMEENVSRRAAFLQGLRELGWEEQRTITFSERWANGHYERLPALAAELVALKVELIVAHNGTPAAVAAMTATRDIPIVVPAMSDPIANKLVRSLAQPGGNVTGLTTMAGELYPKRLALLKEALPEVRHAALLMNNANPYSAEAERLSRTTGRSLGIDIEVFDVRHPQDFEKTFEMMSHARVQAVLVGTEFLFQANVAQLGKLALNYHLPLMAGYHAAGVLLAYNVNNEESYRRAATYVDKILRGAKAGNLPIEQPTHFTLFVDLKTAKALGVTVPQSLLLRADEVVQ